MNVTVKKGALGGMLISAVRYALGRQTYIVADTCGWVRAYWMHLSEADRTVIRSDIRRATNLGAQCDAKYWVALLELIEGVEALVEEQLPLCDPLDVHDHGPTKCRDAPLSKKTRLTSKPKRGKKT